MPVHFKTDELSIGSNSNVATLKIDETAVSLHSLGGNLTSINLDDVFIDFPAPVANLPVEIAQSIQARLDAIEARLTALEETI